MPHAQEHWEQRAEAGVRSTCWAVCSGARAGAARAALAAPLGPALIGGRRGPGILALRC